jgi:acetyl-CoA carboxylase, biotin carboxylase subunit
MKRVLIANRGEIAVRLIKAVQALGMRAIAAYSEADKDSLPVRIADESIPVGPAAAAKSYLNLDAMMQAIEKSGADAVHPGYGFLSENFRFAKAVEDAGKIFIGPCSETIRAMGNKERARQMAMKAGIPTVQGSDGLIADGPGVEKLAAEIGFPLMIKASAGGGGRGIRVVYTIGELEKQLAAARAEASAAFGDDGIYIERWIDNARHLEVQVLGDGNDVIHLFERDCSLQRRRQKILEETPSPILDETVRQELYDSAVSFAKLLGYRGAGTLEFLYSEETGQFYFIEMNTRIQVEHSITEQATGVDIVQGMIRVAAGEALPYRQSEIQMRGVAIECRINAEDPFKGFFPNPGRVTDLCLPTDEDVRIDTALFENCMVSPYYDSLIAKVIVWGANRETALLKMEAALKSIRIGGIQTTIPLHLALLRDSAIRNGTYNIHFLESWIANHLKVKSA